MTEDSKKALGNVVQIDEKRIHEHLGELVRAAAATRGTANHGMSTARSKVRNMADPAGDQAAATATRCSTPALSCLQRKNLFAFFASITVRCLLHRSGHLFNMRWTSIG